MRLTLNVDLNENDLFEEKVLEAVKSEARKIAREVVSKEISSEISRIVSRWVKDGSSYGYVGKLEKHMRETVDKEVKKALDGIKIDDDLVEQRVESVLGNVDSRIDYIIGSRLTRSGITGDAEKLSGYIRTIVEEKVKALVPDTVLQMLIAGMKKE